MNITIKKGKTITSLDDWYRIAPPKGEKAQWKVGRSAMEMARFALSERFPVFISDLVDQRHITDKSFECEPEAKTYFEKGMGTGGPRNHDLLMIGNNSIIGIEAKVSESYDKRIKDKRVGASKNMVKRLDSCLSFLYGESIPQNANELYYQLFSATIGTILAAKENHKQKAVVIFLTFSGNVSKDPHYDDKVEKNKKAFKSFCTSLGLSENGGKISFIPGLGQNQIETWITHAEVIIDYNYSCELV